MQTNDRCPNCMHTLENNDAVCPYCNFNIKDYINKPNCLNPFTVLQNKYMLGRVIGVGGFGITYIGWDLNLQTYIAIKEYFPESFASRNTNDPSMQNNVIPNETKKEVYDKGLKRYVEEAQNLSKFYRLQGIVSVKDFFYENGTAYIVMEYINGINLKEYLNNMGGKLDENMVLTLMKPVFESMFEIHNSGLVHRDISPDNIMVDQDGRIKLIDFGSARGQAAETDKTYTVVLKHGYAPSEQYYAKGNQGPWTDIYSLCATMYKMLTGQIPPNSIERMENDQYVAPSAYGISVSQRTEAVLRKGLSVKVADRYQNIGELLADLYGTMPISKMSSNNTPIAAGATYNPPTSLSQQSMHLSMPQDDMGEKKKNKGIIIAAISVLAIVVIVAVVLLVSGGKDDDKDKKTTENTADNPVVTESTPTDSDDTTDTTAATTEEPIEGYSGYVYTVPEKLSDSWTDYTANVDGQLYQFPMPIEDWLNYGWESDGLPTIVHAESFDAVGFYNANMEINAFVANPYINEASIDKCWVVGFEVNLDYYDVASDSVIEFAGGIKLRESTLEDIKKAYGAPDDIYQGTSYVDDTPYTSISYAGDEYEDGMSFTLDQDGKLKEIYIVNTAIPQDALEEQNVSTDVPEMNSLYVVPTAPSADRLDCIVTSEGYHYQLPVPASEFTKNGWEFDTSTDEYLSGDSYVTTYLHKNGSKIEVELTNFTNNAIIPVNAFVTKIKVEGKYCDIEFLFPGNLKIGDPGTAFADIYSDLGEDYNENMYTFGNSRSVYIYDDNYNSVIIRTESDSETDIIDTLSIANDKDISKK